MFTQDIVFPLSGGYLITQKDVFFDRTRFCQLASALLASNDTNLKLDIPPPAIMKARVASSTFLFWFLFRTVVVSVVGFFSFVYQQPSSLWTGKQLFSMILKPNRASPVKANLRTKGKNYSKNEDLCVNDSCKCKDGSRNQMC